MPNYLGAALDAYQRGKLLNSSDGLSAVPSGYGTEYDQLFANNPYRNLTYKKTGWQNFISALGFRTDADRWLEDAQVNAYEYDAGIFSLMQQNEFNSPQAQAERMKAAGQNPDLLGTGDVAGAASPAEDPNGMSQNVGNEEINQLGSSILNLVPSIMSFATNLTQLRGIRAENNLKELEFNDSVIDYSNKFFNEGLTKKDYEEAFTKNDFTNILEAAYSNSKSLAESLFSSPSARKRFQLTYGQHSRSFVAEMQKYKTWDEFEKYRKSLIEKRSSPLYDDDNATMVELTGHILKPYIEWQKKVYEINARKANLRKPELEQGLENAQMANQLEYEQNIDPSLQAGAENTSNERASQENEIINATNDMFEQIMKNLDSKDAWYSDIAKALVGIMRGYLMSNIHASFGRRQQINPTTGGIDDLSSFNVGF